MLKELNRHSVSLVNIVKPGLLTFLSFEKFLLTSVSPLVLPVGINDIYAGESDNLRDTEGPLNHQRIIEPSVEFWC